MMKQMTAGVTEDELYDRIRKNLRKLRMERGCSQEQVAQALGIKRPAYSYYESGRSHISIFTLMTLSGWYGVPVRWFLENSEADGAGAEKKEALAVS